MANSAGKSWKFHRVPAVRTTAQYDAFVENAGRVFDSVLTYNVGDRMAVNESVTSLEKSPLVRVSEALLWFWRKNSFSRAGSTKVYSLLDGRGLIIFAESAALDAAIRDLQKAGAI